MDTEVTAEAVPPARAAVVGLALVVGLVALSWMGRTNYLLFHALVESFSLVVMAGIFVIAWNTRRLASNRYLLVLGVTHLFVAIVAALHAFAYRGMGVFPQGGSNLPTQLWIISRVLEALGFLVAGVSLRREVPVRTVFGVFGGLTVLTLASVWVVPVFPAMYVDGVGLTTTKIVTEYVVMAVFAGAFALLWRDRERFAPNVASLLLWAIGLMIAAGMSFTLYVDVYGFLNFFGHYLALISFILIYRALIHTVLREPYSLLFRELKRREEAEHRIAETLQGAILSAPDRVDGIEIDHAHVSATKGVRVGGDFWDVFSPAPGLVAFVLGDICGKGIEAVASNVMVRVTLRSFAYQDPEPSTVLRRTNRVVSRQLADDKFATVVYGVINVETGEVIVASAGHPDPILHLGDTAASVELPRNLPLGVAEGHEFQAGACTLAAGGALVLFSDGLIEAGPRSGMFGVDRVLRHLVSDSRRGPGVSRALLESALAHAGGSIDDDVAVMVLRFAPKAV